MHGTDELISEILQLSKRFRSGEMLTLTGNELSDIAFRLSGYKTYLGEKEADLRKDMELLGLNLDLQKDQTFSQARKQGESIADAEVIKRAATVDTARQLINNRYLHRLVGNLYEDCRVMIDAIKSRQIQFQQEREH